MDEMTNQQQVTTSAPVTQTQPPSVETPMAQPAAQLPFASFLDRFLAVLIDVLILFSVGFVLGLLLGMLKLQDMAGVIGTLLNWGYLVYFIGSTGQTPGKKVMKIRVVKVNGAKITYVDAFIREIVGKFVSFIILFIGYLWMLWDPNKQCLHDKIAGTYVVKEG